METFVPPVLHPLDQFRRDHPLPEEQGKDVGLKEAPQDGGIEDGRGDETSVRPEGPGESQDMQVGMPVQKLPGGLDGDDSSGKSVAAGIFTEERGKSLPGAQGEFGEKPSPIPECRPQDLGECEDEMPVRNRADHLLPDETTHRAARLAQQEGQNPRCLQEKATRYSFPQTSHRMRAKPPSGRPHPK
jgi:hypothetical protein